MGCYLSTGTAIPSQKTYLVAEPFKKKKKKVKSKFVRLPLKTSFPRASLPFEPREHKSRNAHLIQEYAAVKVENELRRDQGTL